jgi:hypothetical protein
MGPPAGGFNLDNKSVIKNKQALATATYSITSGHGGARLRPKISASLSVFVMHGLDPCIQGRGFRG